MLKFALKQSVPSFSLFTFLTGWSTAFVCYFFCIFSSNTKHESQRFSKNNKRMRVDKRRSRAQLLSSASVVTKIG